MDPYKKRQLNENDGVPLPPDEPPQQQLQQPKFDTLAPIQTDQVDKEELIEEYKLLIEYKKNELKLNKLIQSEEDPEQLEELQAMKQELTEAVIQQQEKIEASQNDKSMRYNNFVIEEHHLGRLCKAYFEQENKWFHAQIVSIDPEEQICEIQFIGYKDVLKLHSVFVKLMPKPEQAKFQVGTECEAIYSDDGKYYPCVIQKVEDDKYIVEFTKYKNKETVTLYHLREGKKKSIPNLSQKVKHFEDLSEFKIPDHLKLQSTDTQQQKDAKRKKVKALKQQFKQAVIEKETSEKQNKWNAFQNKKGKTKSIFSTNDNINSKVGVMNSGKGMSNFGIKERMQLGDNSYLSTRF